MGARSGFGLEQGGEHALAVASLHAGRPRRRGELARGQRHGAFQQIGLGEAAQRHAEAVATRLGAKLRPEVDPGFAELVLVERGLAGMGQHTGRQQIGGGTGQTGLPCRVAAAAAVEIELHVQHGQGRAGHQVDARATGMRPVFDGNGRVRWQQRVEHQQPGGNQARADQGGAQMGHRWLPVAAQWRVSAGRGPAGLGAVGSRRPGSGTSTAVVSCSSLK